MQSPEAHRERIQSRWSVLFTAILGVCMIGLYLQGPQLVVLLGSLAFMAGYVVERLRLSRTIVALLDGRDHSTPPASASSPA